MLTDDTEPKFDIPMPMQYKGMKSPLGTCDACHGPVDGTEERLRFGDHGLIYLHPRCRGHFLAKIYFWVMQDRNA
jgi:hypothetical protein